MHDMDEHFRVKLQNLRKHPYWTPRKMDAWPIVHDMVISTAEDEESSTESSDKWKDEQAKKNAGERQLYQIRR